MKDLPTPEKILLRHSEQYATNGRNYNGSPYINAMQEYATLVRDKTLQVAADNLPNEAFEIHQLKDHKDLQI